MVLPIAVVNTHKPGISSLVWKEGPSCEEDEDVIIVSHRHSSTLLIYSLGQSTCSLIKSLHTIQPNAEGNTSIVCLPNHSIIAGSSMGMLRLWDTNPTSSSKPCWEIFSDTQSTRSANNAIVSITLLEPSTFLSITRAAVVSIFCLTSLAVKSFGLTKAPTLIIRCALTLPYNSHLLRASLSPRKDFMLLTTSDERIYFYNIENGTWSICFTYHWF